MEKIGQRQIQSIKELVWNSKLSTIEGVSRCIKEDLKTR